LHPGHNFIFELAFYSTRPVYAATAEIEIRLPFFLESGYNNLIFFGKKEGGTT